MWVKMNNRQLWLDKEETNMETLLDRLRLINKGSYDIISIALKCYKIEIGHKSNVILENKLF